MLKLLISIFFYFLLNCIHSQTNFSFSNSDFDQYLKGNFDAKSFEKRLIIPDSNLANYIQKEINSDSLYKYLRKIVSFNNRNTVNDTISEPNKGIRGARNYIRSMLEYWNSQPNSVILNSEFEFDYVICNRTRHKELVSFIPGNGSEQNEMVIVEAHLDSRCEDRCDIDCLAEGAEDNGSGAALIMELARILSKIEFNRSIIIVWITGEEQGLGGSRSLATYCKSKDVKIKAVFNNDIVGGIECGKTSSARSCPGPFNYDSTHLRIFSAGTTNSMHKNLARMTKLIMDQNLNFDSPTKIDIMFAEDRTGRGSDHIPFRENGFTAIRYTSSYEHGDGNPDQPGYEDRQHSTRDVLGKDFNGDGVLDSLFVNFNYLAHNTFVNAFTVSNAATNTINMPSLKATVDGNKLIIDLQNQNQKSIGFYIGIRKITSAYFDTVVFSRKPQVEIDGLTSTQYYVSATAVDSSYWFSMIGNEVLVKVLNGTSESKKESLAYELIQNKPNPYDDFTLIPIIVNDLSAIKEAELIIFDSQGMEIQKIRLNLKEGLNEILFELPKHNVSGQYLYSLKINGLVRKTLKMQVLNF